MSNFNDLSLGTKLTEALSEREFTSPTEIQRKAIPLLLQGEDLIGLSQTGTGKTLAFLLPILEKLNPENPDVQALILCPTRELAQQTLQEVRMFTNIEDLRAVALFGGSDMAKQIYNLKRKANIVIGTPGRTLDHISRHTLRLQNIKTLVLDEADEMLNMGFRDDIEKVIAQTPSSRQTVLFSATMNNDVLKLSKKFMREPKQIKVGEQNSTLATIKQSYLLVPRDKKRTALNALLRQLPRGRTLIFSNTKAMVGNVQSYLEKFGFNVIALHGDMPQSMRTKIMRAYKAGEADILVTTDLSARGIDVSDILHVINFDLPQNLEYYIHRIGRTARAGKQGNAWTLLNSPEQQTQIRELERKLKCKINMERIDLTVGEPLGEVESIQSKIENSSRSFQRGGRSSYRGGDTTARRPRFGEKTRTESGRTAPRRGAGFSSEIKKSESGKVDKSDDSATTSTRSRQSYEKKDRNFSTAGRRKYGQSNSLKSDAGKGRAERSGGFSSTSKFDSRTKRNYDDKTSDRQTRTEEAKGSAPSITNTDRTRSGYRGSNERFGRKSTGERTGNRSSEYAGSHSSARDKYSNKRSSERNTRSATKDGRSTAARQSKFSDGEQKSGRTEESQTLKNSSRGVSKKILF